MQLVTYTFKEKRTNTGDNGQIRETNEIERTHTIDMHETLTRCARVFRYVADLATTIYGPLLQRINIGTTSPG